jgi:purine-nucleoside phosphorylase
VRVFKALGCEVLIVSNACGGMNPQWAKGDLMAIEDHINLLGDNPLIGPNDDGLGDRFPDMCNAYDRELLGLTRRLALEEKIVCHQGVFVAVSGPNLETRAEYRFLRGIGADVVGMSTVPEVIVAVHARLRVLGLSVITDVCLPDALEPVSLADIIATASAAEKKLRVLVRRVVEALP